MVFILDWYGCKRVCGQNANRQNAKWFVGILSGLFLSSSGILSVSICFGILSRPSKHDLAFCPNHEIHFGLGWERVRITLRDSAYALYFIKAEWHYILLSVCGMSGIGVTQISTFSIIYRHTSPFLTFYQPISSSTNLYWPSTSHYRHILTQ